MKSSTESNKKPKVLFLGPVPPPFMGPTLATEVIINSSINEQFELIHLDTSDHREIDTLGALDFWNFYLAAKFYLMLIGKILRHWPDLVYIPVSQTTIGYLKDSGFIILSKLLGRRVICHLRGGNFRNWLSGASSLTRWYVKLIHSRINGQIVLGQCLKPLFTDVLPVDRIHVVPNGKDISYEHQASGNARPKILFLANIIRTKGVMDVLYAARLTAEQGVDADFVFCGSWEDLELKEEIENFLKDHTELPIEWVGTVKGQQKQSVIESADIFVFPTYYPPEGHPWVVIEAMAAGLPVISCDQGAITESVVDHVNGYIVEKQAPEALALKIQELAENEELRQRMGAESLRLYQERFTEERMVEQLGTAFKRTLAQD